MAVGPVLSGKQVELLPVKPEDAEFIISLRTDPKLSRFLHPTKPNIDLQLKWIHDQIQRAGDFYYVIYEKSTKSKVGLISVYNCADEHAEVGRWICTEPVCAVESFMLSCDFVFTQDARRYAVLKVDPENKKVLTFHKTLGAEISDGNNIDVNPDESLLTYVLRREIFMELKGKFM